MVRSRHVPGDVLLLVLAGVVVALAFAPALLGGFLLDDLSQLPFAAQLTGWDWFGVDVYGMPRPGKNLLFMWLGSAWPTTPAAWHIAGLVAHTMNVALLGVVAKRFGFRQRSAVILALVWGLAPTSVATVCWVSCLNIQVATFWALIYLICSVGPSDEPLEGLWVFLGLTSLGLALFFYEALVPVVVLPWLWRVTRVGWRRASDARSLVSAVGGVLVVAAVLFWRGSVSPGFGTAVLNEQIVGASAGRLSTASGYLLLRHAVLWLWPFGRQGVLTSIDLSDSATLVAVFSSIFSLLAFAVLLVKGWGMRQGRRMVFGVLWFIGCMLPLCNLIPLGNGPVADYYLYFSSIGLALCVVVLGELLDARRLTGHGSKLVVAQLLLGALITWRALAAVVVPSWAMYWKDEASLLRRTVANDPTAHAAKAALAARLVDAGKLEEAEVLAREALMAVPTLTQGRFALGGTYLQTRRPIEAAVVYAGLVRDHPDNIAARVMLGVAFDQAGQQARALKAYRAALGMPWDVRFSWMAARNLAGSLFANDQQMGALRVLEEALARAPSEGRLHQTAAVVALELGRVATAQEHARSAARYGAPLDAGTLTRIEAAASDRTAEDVSP